MRIQILILGFKGLRRETLFHDPDSFHFTDRLILFSKLTLWNQIFRKEDCQDYTTVILKHTLPALQYGQYLTHAHNHITSAAAAMDSCFILVRTHQHDIASTVSLTITHPAFTAEVSAKYSFKRQLHHTHVVAVAWEPQAVLGKRMEMGSVFY